ncbi:receptor-type tyrosine-protein phosphatase H [Strongylocentrotus purpuratus]|uniref:Fibronectin type-III domain-containing protein n=1 Tax=Strongylocentrotus purpuratus TaxID=7668 RepID=A0A7M7P1Q0_STRPU|nr:receptor-type tyrosine-protein phosphatase H [Strongylocentrotus purpuratus]
MEGNRPCRHLGLSILGLILICTLQDSVAIDAPDIVTVENEGNTDSLKVTWTPPTGATDQVVTWSPADGSGSDTSFGLSGTATEHTIPGLTPGTLYNVTVTAQNGTDETSDDSEQGRTKPSPVNLTESGATNDSISAEWTKPSGAIDQYTFSCSEGTEDPSSPITDVSSNMYEVSCVGLSAAGADYTITVTSLSGNEISNESTTTITALPNMVHIEAGDATNSSFVASWNHPEGEMDSFQVFCYENDTAPEEISDVGSNSTYMYEVTCESLPTAGTGYQFSVISISGSKNVTSETVLYTSKLGASFGIRLYYFHTSSCNIWLILGPFCNISLVPMQHNPVTHLQPLHVHLRQHFITCISSGVFCSMI